MRIIISIILNALIFYIIAILLGENKEIGISSGVILGCTNCSVSSFLAWKTYIIAGVILGIINVTIKPILKILSLPFFILSFGLITIVINSIILGLLTYVLNDLLQISGVGYTISGWSNFVIAVAIFTILNMFYSLLIFKK